MPRVFGEAQPQIDRGRRLISQALQQLREELTPEQWRRIPTAVRDPYGTGGRPGSLTVVQSTDACR
jgi:predicted alternative tryptophan synthase beta-subunit